jgi:ribonuclease HII
LKPAQTPRRTKFDRNLLPERPDLSYEQSLWAKGLLCVGGIDEAGRGAWAGPVAAAAVILSDDHQNYSILNGVRDSKEMTPGQRGFWAERIKEMAAAWGVGMASQQEIDRLGILPATRLAMQRSLEELPVVPHHLLIDFVELPAVDIPQTSLVKGDARSLSIAAASVLAKTARDALMVEMDASYPGYGFAAHKGYGTRQHMAALERMGPCPIHRRSFAPIALLLTQDRLAISDILIEAEFD